VIPCPDGEGARLVTRHDVVSGGAPRGAPFAMRRACRPGHVRSRCAHPG